MSEAKIFLVNQGKKELTPMTETTYATEDDLQAFLARYPDLLPGDQIDPENPRRWLLVSRELSVPGTSDGGGRQFSLDHLFLDQDGIPTFVECKRSSDTRIRREVVAQMLDYAANGIEYWSMDRLRQAAAETASEQEAALDDEIADLIEAEDDADVEAYWDQVEGNLRSGKVRLVFVADQIPKELWRLVEFMNEKMSDVEVLAVEVRQFLGKGEQTVLVPRVIGLTEAIRAAKRTSISDTRHTTHQEFLAKCLPEVKPFYERVLDLAEQRGHIVYWGKVGFSVRMKVPTTGKLASFVYGYPTDNGTNFQFYFGYLPLTPEEKLNLRRKLLEFGLFRESGKQTLLVIADKDNVIRLNELYDFILDQIDHISQLKSET